MSHKCVKRQRSVHAKAGRLRKNVRLPRVCPLQGTASILNDADMTQGLLLFRGAFYTGDG